MAAPKPAASTCPPPPAWKYWSHMFLFAHRQIFTQGWVPKGAEMKTQGQMNTNRAAGEERPLREFVWVGVWTQGPRRSPAWADSASTLRSGAGGTLSLSLPICKGEALLCLTELQCRAKCTGGKLSACCPRQACYLPSCSSGRMGPSS